MKLTCLPQLCYIKIPVFNANNVDPDQMAYSAMFGVSKFADVSYYPRLISVLFSVIFLGSFHDPSLIFEQLSVLYMFPR